MGEAEALYEVEEMFEVIYTKGVREGREEEELEMGMKGGKVGGRMRERVGRGR